MCARVIQGNGSNPDESPDDGSASNCGLPAKPVFAKGLQGTPVHSRMLRNFRPRKCGWNGASPRAGHATPLLSRQKRTGNGACSRRICEGELSDENAGVHHFDWPRRDKHGDRCGGCDGESTARTSVAGRYLRAAERGAGSSAGGVLRLAGYFRKRLLPARLALLGSHSAPGADPHFVARGDEGTHVTERNGSRDDLPTSRCSDGSARFPGRVLSEADVDHPAKSQRCEPAGPRRGMDSFLEKSARRRRRRRSLFRSLGGPLEICDAHRNPCV